MPAAGAEQPGRWLAAGGELKGTAGGARGGGALGSCGGVCCRTEPGFTPMGTDTEERGTAGGGAVLAGGRSGAPESSPDAGPGRPGAETAGGGAGRAYVALGFVCKREAAEGGLPKLPPELPSPPAPLTIEAAANPLRKILEASSPAAAADSMTPPPGHAP